MIAPIHGIKETKQMNKEAKKHSKLQRVGYQSGGMGGVMGGLGAGDQEDISHEEH